MRFALTFATLCSVALFAGCGATEEDACENVAVVCGTDAREPDAASACESAVSNANQTVLNCIDAARTCDAALACAVSGT